jgi:hypothetical protein
MHANVQPPYYVQRAHPRCKRTMSGVASRASEMQRAHPSCQMQRVACTACLDRSALTCGISAEQIVEYLAAHAHPQAPAAPPLTDHRGGAAYRAATAPLDWSHPANNGSPYLDVAPVPAHPTRMCHSNLAAPDRPVKRLGDAVAAVRRCATRRAWPRRCRARSGNFRTAFSPHEKLPAPSFARRLRLTRHDARARVCIGSARRAPTDDAGCVVSEVPGG